ncbi:MAG: class II aldolase/adducin family protein [Betaproteobacteria bacterium]|nr:class II aldolase/adducin family protein [Betaproteobacteria bacterium]
MSAEAKEDAQRREELVIANRILAQQGVLDGFGHVTVRSAQNPRHYFMSQSRAPELVSADDILEYDEDSQPVDLRGRPQYGERYIHGEILRARPDINAVIHSHSPSVIPFGTSRIALRPICHMAAFLPQVSPVFEIRDAEGEKNSMLVLKKPTGAALAAKLGSAPMVLMRGHGNAVVGSTLKIAVFRAIYTEVNARLQGQALGMGETVYLNEFEAENMDALSRAAVERPWELWKKKAMAG